jgi:GT2 family glycosyltransferase
MLGVVVIGRNEGERLKRCLQSTAESELRVYVDSGSTDGSVEWAREHGVSVVELDMSIPFTMARGRNAGFRKLLEISPAIEFVQFVDGDCEIQPGWLQKGSRFLADTPKAAVVSGRRRERFPDRNLFHRLTDREWNTPVGVVDACHGDAMMRVTALQQTGLFDETMIAGEEPELCLRLRNSGWEIHRIDAVMTHHDVAMSRFSQWWKRSVRCGYAYALSAWMHGSSSERYCLKPVLSTIAWGFLLPTVILLATLFVSKWSLVLLGLYALLWMKVVLRECLDGETFADASAYAASIVIGKFSQLVGALQFWRDCLTGKRRGLIEYKSPTA